MEFFYSVTPVVKLKCLSEEAVFFSWQKPQGQSSAPAQIISLTEGPLAWFFHVLNNSVWVPLYLV